MDSDILILNGPNLNLLGQREQSQYGSITFDQLKKNCLKKANELNINLEFLQSNIEGEIVTIIQEAKKKFDGIIINAAGFTHTSVAIRDALDIFKKPIIELHISNIYKREEFRQKSVTAGAATGVITGFGPFGYHMGLIALMQIISEIKAVEESSQNAE